MRDNIRQHFQLHDPKILDLLERFSDVEMRTTQDYFVDLCSGIVQQQLSVKAGDTIWKRFAALFPENVVTPEGVLGQSDEALRNVGTSNAKVRYVKDLAQHIVDGRLNFANIVELSDSKVIEALTAVKGIGPWTAEMFLMFALGREDVFSFGDLGLLRAMQKMYGLGEKPTKAEILTIVEKWSPYKTWACRVLWKSLDNE